MTRAEVTDRGLSSRLGQKVFVSVGRSGEKIEGELVYYPDGFAVLASKERLIPIKRGDVVGLRRGSVFASYDPHLLGYKYIGG